MLDWELKDPWFIALAMLAPLVYLLMRRAKSTVLYSSVTMVRQASRSLRARLAFIPPLTMALAVVCLSVGLARPRTPDALTRVKREGIAIMLVIDRSGSMEARDLVKGDYSIDRLSVVKDVVKSFVLGGESMGSGRPDDIIGLVSFAGYADSHCPLTLDHGNLSLMVDELEVVHDRNEDGTAIGDALALAVERLRRSKAKSRIVVLLTDGENNAGVIRPMQSAELAADHQIKVYCIGTGTNGIAPMPTIDPFTQRTRLMSVRVSIDEKTLQEIAGKTNGKYFRATDAETLEQIYQEIDRLERTEISETRFLRYSEHYQWWVGIAICLIGFAMLGSMTIFRRLP